MIMNNMQGLSNDDMNPSSAQTQVIALLEYLTFHVVWNCCGSVVLDLQYNYSSYFSRTCFIAIFAS